METIETHEVEEEERSSFMLGKDDNEGGSANDVDEIEVSPKRKLIIKP